jgi:hypothetical protein
MLYAVTATIPVSSNPTRKAVSGLPKAKTAVPNTTPCTTDAIAMYRHASPRLRPMTNSVTANPVSSVHMMPVSTPIDTA